MSYTSRNILFIGLCAAVFGIASFSAWRYYKTKPAAPKNELAKVSLRLSWIPQGTFAGDYAAEMKGFWRDEGLDVTINPGGFEYDSIKLVTGKVDTIGVTSGAKLMEARANGAPIVAIAVVIPESPIAWVSKAESGIKRVEDFVGKKIGDQTGSLTEITLDAAISSVGISEGQFKRIPMKFDYTPFLSDAIEVAPVYIIDQVVTFKRNGIKINVIDPRNYGINLGPANLYFVHEDTLKTSKPILSRFLRAVASGWRYAEANRQPVADYLSKLTKEGNPEATMEQMDAIFEFVNAQKGYPGLFPINPNTWQTTVNTLIKSGRIKKPFESSKGYENSL